MCVFNYLQDLIKWIYIYNYSIIFLKILILSLSNFEQGHKSSAGACTGLLNQGQIQLIGTV